MPKQTIRIVPSLTKSVFASEDRSYVVVLQVSDMVDTGTPINPDNGDDLEYVGQTPRSVPSGTYAVGDFDLVRILDRVNQDDSESKRTDEREEEAAERENANRNDR